MRQTAAKILVDADLALTQHITHWGKVTDFVSRFPGFMQGTILAVLHPYEQRMRDSFQWQMDFASTIFDAADQIDGADEDVSNSFKPRPKGFDHSPYGRQNVE